MFQLYPLVLLVQAFCIYHVYSNRADQKWYWIIIFLPFIGSLIYLYDTFYSRRNVDNLFEGLKSTFVSNYKIDRLEKQLKFSDTVANRMELADEHLVVGNYERAFKLYESCLKGMHKDDPKLLQKLVLAAYHCEEYEKAIAHGNQIKDSNEFKKSTEKIAYAWSFYHINDLEKAEEVFQSMDARFSNYEQRLAYASFLEQLGRSQESREKLETLLEEIDFMDRQEQKLKKDIYKQIKKQYSLVS